MINTERINSQLSLSHEKAIASVDPRGGEQINSQCREGQQCCEIMIVPLRTLRPQYLRAKHGVATSKV